MNNLEIELKNMSVEGKLYREIPGKPYRIQCYACAHYCSIKEGKSGICKVRYNKNGKLMVPHGYVSAMQADPIEKKPYFHVKPGTLALSVGMMGCDMHCSYCQNWDISQALRDDQAVRSIKYLTSQEIVDYALATGASSVVSTYNEPLITSEWSQEIFVKAKKQNLLTGYVSNGNASTEVLDYIKPNTDIYKIDLKTFNEKNYTRLGASLPKILKAIKEVYRKGFWLEIVTLLIPEFNNSKSEIEEIATFISDISVDIPWHISAYHQDYKMHNHENTKVNQLVEAGEIGRKIGLNHIYLGNLGVQQSKWENTYCDECNTELISRRGHKVIENRLDKGCCPKCGKEIPGIWGNNESGNIVNLM